MEMAQSYKKELDFVSHVKELSMMSYPCNPSRQAGTAKPVGFVGQPDCLICELQTQ